MITQTDGFFQFDLKIARAIQLNYSADFRPAITSAWNNIFSLDQKQLIEATINTISRKFYEDPPPPPLRENGGG